MNILEKDILILRQLGEEYMKYASLPVQREKLDLWKSLNSCKMERPMVIIDQLPWNEICDIEPEAMKPQVSDSYWRQVECNLRQSIYKWKNFPVDMVLEPYITIPAPINFSSYGLIPEEDILVTSENETASSHHYKATLKEPEDIGKIQDIKLSGNDSEASLKLQEAEFIFEGIAAVKMSHGVQFHLGVWDRLSEYMSVENVYFDLIDRPEFLHAAMRRITDATLAGIKAANELGLHDDIASACHCSYVYTPELLPDFGMGQGPISKNCWAFGLAQLFTSVSPDITREFELPYIKEMAAHFGMIYYGCCDRLDDRLDVIKQIPNLKKLSCSPWSNRDNFAEKIGKKLVLSNKPTPAFLSDTSFDEDVVRKDIMHTINAARANDVSLELILKDISTVKHDISRLRRWHEIAMEAVMNY